MGSSTPKQYLLLGDQPVLIHTLHPFMNCAEITGICLVLPPSDLQRCREEILAPFGLRDRVVLAAGGTERQESVYNGLVRIGEAAGLEGQEIVLIHDAVRPFVRAEDLRNCIQEAEADDACILAAPAFDTVKRVDASGLIEATLPRESLWMAQTPQGFRYRLIREAHEAAGKAGYSGTDDAALVERLGKGVRVTPGHRWNIKITDPADLALAEALLPSWRG